MEVRGRKEVILSAGSIGSPQILLQSGVGPKDHLESVGIPIVHELPGVGENLQDHILLGIVVRAEHSHRIGAASFDSVNPISYLNYFTRGKGPLTSNGIEAGGFVFTKANNDSLNRPDLQMHTFPATYGIDFDLMFRRAVNIADEQYYGHFKDDLDKDGGVLMPSLLRPKSRGYIRLRTNNPHDYPVIQPNYYSNPKDIETMMEGLKISLKMATTSTCKNYKMKPLIDTFNCGQFDHESDDYLKCFIKHWTFTIYHPVGTCKMGPRNDPNAVVDGELKVHGIPNLRVIDGSIMPTIVGGNTNAPCIMIGEKGAHMVSLNWLHTAKKQIPPRTEL